MVTWVDYRGMQVPDVSTGEGGENLTANLQELANRAAKTNFSATTNPGPGDDVGDGYYPGSLWVNTSAQTIYICVSNASGAAVWQQIGSGVSDGDKGDITVSSSGTTWTIDNNVVNDAKLRDSAAVSVIGRASNSSGDPADIAAANDGEVLRRSGTSLGFGTIATAGIADDQVTFAKMQNIASQRLVGRQAASSGDPTEITVAAGSNVSLDWSTSNTLTISATGGGGSGTVTSVGLSLPGMFSVSGSPVTTSGTLTGSLATQSSNSVFAGPSSGAAAAPTFRSMVTSDIPDGTVTLAKIVDASAQYAIMARTSSGSGDWQELQSSAAVFSLLDDTTIPAIRGTIEISDRLANLADNVSFELIRRHTSASTTTVSNASDGTYGPDRWYSLCETTSTNTSTRARSGGTATIVTGTAHGLTTGDIVTLTGIANYNQAFFTATVTNSTTFTYSGPTGTETTTSDTNGRIGTVAFKQMTDSETGSHYSIQIKQLHATAQRMAITQVVPGDVAIGLRSKSVRLQCRVKSSTGSVNIRCAVLEWTGSFEGPTRDPVSSWGSTPTWISNVATIGSSSGGTVAVSANTWADLSFTGTVSSSATNLYLIIWTESTTSQGGTLEIGQVVFAEGVSARTFYPRRGVDELQRCNPHAHIVDGTTANTHFGSGMANSTTTCRVMIPFPATMRTVPTVAYSNLTDFGVLASSLGVAGTMSSIVSNHSSIEAGALDITTSSGLNSSGPTMLITNNTLNARMVFSADY